MKQSLSLTKTILLVAAVFCLLAHMAAETKLHIGGATLPEVIYKETTLFFNKRYRGDYQATYKAVGSGKGRQGLIDGTYDIGCSDTYVPIAGAHYFPTIASPIAAFYSISTLRANDTLVLSRECLGDIFAGKLLVDQALALINLVSLLFWRVPSTGKVTSWRDPCIAKTNGDIIEYLPNNTIQVLVPSWQSGTARVFTCALAAFSAAFKLKYGSSGFENPSLWDQSTVQLSTSQDTQMMVNEALSKDNTITFGGTSMGDAVDAPVVSLINKAGNAVKPDTSSVESAIVASIDFYSGIPSLTYGIELINTEGNSSWPVVALTYMIV